MEIKYKMGELQTFTATRSFALGAFNVTVAKGAEIEFDGSSAQYAGMTYTFPALRGAVKAGWLVLATDYNEGDASYGVPVSAGIKMHSPVGGNEPPKLVPAVTTEADERIVMSSADHATTTREQNKTGRRAVVGGAEDQDGVEVRTLKTAAGNRAKNTRTVLTAESAGTALREAENVQIVAGRGQSEAEMLERMSAPDREVYLAEKASIKQRYVDSPEVVNTVKTAAVSNPEGMKLTQTVGGGIETADPTGMGGKAKASTRVEDGITFKNTNGPEKKEQPHPRSAEANQPVMMKDGTADARRQIAKAICPEFPSSYDFAAPERKKLARLQADFEDNAPVIRAVFAAESDTFKARILEEFPQAFRG
jgi:hypothetical protein